MSRRTYLKPTLKASAAAVVVSTLSSCGLGAVDVDEFEPEPGSTDACAALFADLPDTLGNAVRRDVNLDDSLAAAWGSPPIVLRCGVGLPAAYRPDAQLFEVDGVSWLAEDGEGGRFFTSVQRQVLVEVAVPSDYSPEAEILTELADPIAGAIPQVAG